MSFVYGTIIILCNIIFVYFEYLYSYDLRTFNGCLIAKLIVQHINLVWIKKKAFYYTIMDMFKYLIWEKNSFFSEDLN